MTEGMSDAETKAELLNQLRAVVAELPMAWDGPPPTEREKRVMSALLITVNAVGWLATDAGWGRRETPTVQ